MPGGRREERGVSQDRELVRLRPLPGRRGRALRPAPGAGGANRYPPPNVRAAPAGVRSSLDASARTVANERSSGAARTARSDATRLAAVAAFGALPGVHRTYGLHGCTRSPAARLS